MIQILKNLIINSLSFENYLVTLRPQIIPIRTLWRNWRPLSPYFLTPKPYPNKRTRHLKCRVYLLRTAKKMFRGKLNTSKVKIQTLKRFVCDKLVKPQRWRLHKVWCSNPGHLLFLCHQLASPFVESGFTNQFICSTVSTRKRQRKDPGLYWKHGQALLISPRTSAMIARTRRTWMSPAAL